VFILAPWVPEEGKQPRSERDSVRRETEDPLGQRDEAQEKNINYGLDEVIAKAEAS